MNDYEKTGIVRWMLFPLRAVLVRPLVLTSACAFTTGHVDLAYAPTTTASRSSDGGISAGGRRGDRQASDQDSR